MSNGIAYTEQDEQFNNLETRLLIDDDQIVCIEVGDEVGVTIVDTTEHPDRLTYLQPAEDGKRRHYCWAQR